MYWNKSQIYINKSQVYPNKSSKYRNKSQIYLEQRAGQTHQVWPVLVLILGMFVWGGQLEAFSCGLGFLGSPRMISLWFGLFGISYNVLPVVWGSAGRGFLLLGFFSGSAGRIFLWFGFSWVIWKRFPVFWGFLGSPGMVFLWFGVIFLGQLEAFSLSLLKFQDSILAPGCSSPHLVSGAAQPSKAGLCKLKPSFPGLRMVLLHNSHRWSLQPEGWRTMRTSGKSISAV